MFSLVNGPLLCTFLLRTGVRVNNGELYYGAMNECLSLDPNDPNDPMIQNQVASPKSKQPKKTPKQAFKFKCKYCNKKIKTRAPFKCTTQIC